jgi:hypothetical protein
MLTREQIVEQMRVAPEQVPDEWSGHWTDLLVISAEGDAEGELLTILHNAEQGDTNAQSVLRRVSEWGPGGGIAVWDDYYWVPPTWDEEWLLDLADCTCEVDWTGLRERVQNALNAEAN